MLKPLFQHDCSNCTFLGTVIAYEQPYDLYFCPQGGLPTVIARWSSNGPDYTSGDCFAASNPALKCAKVLAVARGLMVGGS